MMNLDFSGLAYLDDAISAGLLLLGLSIAAVWCFVGSRKNDG